MPYVQKVVHNYANILESQLENTKTIKQYGKWEIYLPAS